MKIDYSSREKIEKGLREQSYVVAAGEIFGYISHLNQRIELLSKDNRFSKKLNQTLSDEVRRLEGSETVPENPVEYEKENELPELPECDDVLENLMDENNYYKQALKNSARALLFAMEAQEL